jgi:hypothetical protein
MVVESLIMRLKVGTARASIDWHLGFELFNDIPSLNSLMIFECSADLSKLEIPSMRQGLKVSG